MQASLYLSKGECGLADMGYADIWRLDVPKKQGTNVAFPFCCARNKSIGGKRMVNEWDMRYVNNRYRIFLHR